MGRAFLVLAVLAFLVAAPVFRVISSAGGTGSDPERDRPWPAGAEEGQRSRQLNTELTDVRSREAEKGRVVTRLVRGELDLDQSVAQFADLGATPERLELMRRRYPTATDEERVYWLVLWYTRGVTDVPADQVAAAQTRIFAAFRRRYPNSPDPAADPYLRPVTQAQVAGR